MRQTGSGRPPPQMSRPPGEPMKISQQNLMHQQRHPALRRGWTAGPGDTGNGNSVSYGRAGRPINPGRPSDMATGSNTPAPWWSAPRRLGLPALSAITRTPCQKGDNHHADQALGQVEAAVAPRDRGARPRAAPQLLLRHGPDRGRDRPALRRRRHLLERGRALQHRAQPPGAVGEEGRRRRPAARRANSPPSPSPTASPWATRA